MNGLELLIVALAASRLTRLVVADSITEPLRQKVWRRYPAAGVGFGDSEVTSGGTDTLGREVAYLGERGMFRSEGAWYAVSPSWMGNLIECSWCTGFWVGIGVFSLYWFYPVTVPYLAALAVAEVIGILNDR